MVQKLQLVEQPPKPERAPAEKLTVGQFLAAGALTTGRPTEVLFTDTYPMDGGGRETLIVHRPLAVDYSIASHVGGNHWFDLATEADLARFRGNVERAQKIADIHALADWLESNPDMPMPFGDFYAYVDGEPRSDHGPEGMAKMRRLAQAWGVELNERPAEHTTVTRQFGGIEYEVRCFHRDGRPAEPVAEAQAFLDKMHGLADEVRAAVPEPPVAHPSWPTEAELKPWESLAPLADRVAESVELADPTGLLHSRADDEPDDPRPVSGARVEAHVGGMTDEGLVDETPASPVTVYFSFGHGQTDPDTGKNMLDRYVTIVGPSYDMCVAAMFASRYGDRWAFPYPARSGSAEEWIPQWTEHERIVLAACGCPVRLAPEIRGDSADTLVEHRDDCTDAE